MDQKMNIDLSAATDLTCEKCNSKFFSEALMLKRVSRLLTASDRDQIVPISVLRCADCGHVNADMMPIIPGAKPQTPPIS